jgi:flagellar motor switch protein FliN/FliY
MDEVSTNSENKSQEALYQNSTIVGKNSEEVNLRAVYDVPLQISAVLGRAKMKINQIVKLSRGSVIELDRKVGDSVDIFVNDRIVAKGEIVLVDNKIAVTLTELVKTNEENN